LLAVLVRKKEKGSWKEEKKDWQAKKEKGISTNSKRQRFLKIQKSKKY